MFLGLDLSLNSTGVCECTDSTLNHYTIKPKGSIKGMERLEYNLGELIRILDRQEHIAGCAVEGYAVNRQQPGNAPFTGEWGGIARLELYKRNIPTIIVPPTNLKKYIGGSGQFKKNMILMKVFQKYGVECKNDDEADALGLSCMAEDYFTGKQCTYEYEREALEKVALLFVRKRNVRNR